MRRGFLSFCGRVSRSRTRLTRKNSHFPPSIARVASHFRKMRTAHFRGDAWQKCDFAALYYSFWVQRHAAAFHVFAKAKTFHFCAEDMLAYCSLLSAQKFHVRSKGAQVRLTLIAPLRRTSVCRARCHSPYPQKFTLSACAALRAEQSFHSR